MLYWHLTDGAGHGDLRLYYLVQAIPIVTVPVICLLFEGRITNARYVLYMTGWYVAALACEKLDHEIYEAAGQSVSGHTVKHLLSAIAIGVVLAMLRSAAARQRVGDPADRRLARTGV